MNRTHAMNIHQNSVFVPLLSFYAYTIPLVSCFRIDGFSFPWEYAKNFGHVFASNGKWNLYYMVHILIFVESRKITKIFMIYSIGWHTNGKMYVFSDYFHRFVSSSNKISTFKYTIILTWCPFWFAILLINISHFVVLQLYWI